MLYATGKARRRNLSVQPKLFKNEKIYMVKANIIVEAKIEWRRHSRKSARQTSSIETET